VATLPPQSNETTTKPAMALPVDQQLFGVVIAPGMRPCPNVAQPMLSAAISATSNG